MIASDSEVIQERRNDSGEKDECGGGQGGQSPVEPGDADARRSAMDVGGCVSGVVFRFDSRAELRPEIGVRFELIRRYGGHGLTQEMLDLVEIAALLRCRVCTACAVFFFAVHDWAPIPADNERSCLRNMRVARKTRTLDRKSTRLNS